VRRTDNLTTFMCRLLRNLGTSASWNPQGLSRSVQGLLYLYILYIYLYIYIVYNILLLVLKKIIVSHCTVWATLQAKIMFGPRTVWVSHQMTATVLLPCRAGRGVWGEFDVTPVSGGHASALGGFVWWSGSQAPWRYPRHVLNERDIKGV